jgi:hypothetical protein
MEKARKGYRPSSVVLGFVIALAAAVASFELLLPVGHEFSFTVGMFIFLGVVILLPPKIDKAQDSI